MECFFHTDIRSIILKITAVFLQSILNINIEKCLNVYPLYSESPRCIAWSIGTTSCHWIETRIFRGNGTRKRHGLYFNPNQDSFLKLIKWFWCLTQEVIGKKSWKLLVSPKTQLQAQDFGLLCFLLYCIQYFIVHALYKLNKRLCVLKLMAKRQCVKMWF